MAVIKLITQCIYSEIVIFCVKLRVAHANCVKQVLYVVLNSTSVYLQRNGLFWGHPVYLSQWKQGYV